MNGFLSEERMEKSKRELAELERKFLDRLLTSSTTPTSSPRNLTKDSNDLAGGERKSKKAKISQKVTAAQDDRVHFKTGNDSQVPLYTGIPDSGDEDSHGGHGRDMLYSPHNQVHSLHPLQQHNPQQYQQYQQHQHQQHQHQQQHPQYSLYSQQNQQSLSTSYLPPPMYPHDAQYSYMGNGGGVGGGGGGGLGSALDSRDRDRGTSPYPPFAPPMNMNMNMGMNIHQGGGSGGVGFPPYPGVRTSSDTSTSSSGGGEGGADDWRQHMGGLGQQSRQMGPFDVSAHVHTLTCPVCFRIYVFDTALLCYVMLCSLLYCMLVCYPSFFSVLPCLMLSCLSVGSNELAPTVPPLTAILRPAPESIALYGRRRGSGQHP